MKFSNLCLILLMSFPVFTASAEDDPPTELPANSMNNERLAGIIKRLDDKAEGRPGFWQLRIEGHEVSVITDEKADRMRIIVPVVRVESLADGELVRLMQSNFDSALDARYAIAKGILWSAFIHPLSSLTDHEFISGLGQAVNLTITYGKSYSSGALIFRGGDSTGLERRELIDELLERGLSI
ncbi:hypothetical protein DFR30_1695 [Thiogranum longum]|uniref:Outer membrane lipoprotein carrier protein LolA n=1 Tax=Thiogranum longum TaxID=1537524 RepID=A0A4R1H972_9GAMM|nr:hypothetical protein [Thiogranum longum]TCK18417.1 hypothetical protein DFR30_1695 [Thiogranum longum]